MSKMTRNRIANINKRLVLFDDVGAETTEGDKVQFTFGIPPVNVVGDVIRRGENLIVLTPNYSPKECDLRLLRDFVGEWFNVGNNQPKD